MRTTTAAELNVLNNQHRATRMRVRVDPGTGTFTDLTALRGYDWVDGADFGANTDAPVMTATVYVKQRAYDMSLATLMVSSVLNSPNVLLDAGYELVIETASIGMDAEPSDSDWKEVFRGDIDEIDWTQSPIQLQCRDLGGRLQDLVIEQQRVVPFHTATAPAQEVMQEIVDNEFGVLSAAIHFDGTATYTDDTSDANDNGAGDVSLATANNHEFFIGAADPFRSVRMYVSTAGVGTYTGTWKYWDGSAWQALASVTDGTNNFKNAGYGTTGYTLPSDWATTTVNSKGPFYYVKWEGSGSGTMTTSPAASQIWAGVVTLYLESGTPSDPRPTGGSDDPSWQIGQYAQQKQPVMEALRTIAMQMGWNVSYRWGETESAFRLELHAPGRAVRARGTLTLTGQPTASQTFTINSTACTAKTSGASTDEFNIGGTIEATVDNIVAMLNAGSESSNIIAWKLSTDKVVIEWRTPGAAGDAVTFTESLSNATADGSGTLGGTIAGSDLTVAHTFDPSLYFDIKKMALNRHQVRNVVRVKYGVHQEDRTTVEVTDDTSITKYGRRFMEIAEDGSSQIDTESEARTMANAILDDVKDPTAEKVVPMPYFWAAEAGDYYTFTANNVHYDTDQSLACYSLMHNLRKDSATTTLVCRGKPAASRKRQLRLDARPGVAGQNDFRSDDAPANTSISADVGKIIVEYDDPRSMTPPINDWAFTKCYVDTSSGFTPSDSNLKATERTTRFEIAGLVPGTTYYAKLVVVDSSGNESAVGTQVTVATAQVGPYHMNPDQEFGTINQNPNFSVFTLDNTANPPDFYSLDDDAVWGTSAKNVYFGTTTAISGPFSLRHVTGSFVGESRNDIVQSDIYPAVEGQLYQTEWSFRHDNTGGAGKTPFVPQIAFFDSSKTIIGGWNNCGHSLNTYDSTGGGLSIAANTWHADRGWNVAPANTRYVRIRVNFSADSTNWTGTDTVPNTYVDYFKVSRGLYKMENLQGSGNDRSIAGSPAAWTAPWLDNSPSLDNEAAFSPGNPGGPTEHDWTCPHDGEYIFEGFVKLTTSTASGEMVARFTLNGSLLAQGGIYSGTGGIKAQSYVCVGPVTISAGDTVRLEAWQNSGSSHTIDNSECFFNVQEASHNR